MKLKLYTGEEIRALRQKLGRNQGPVAAASK